MTSSKKQKKDGHNKIKIFLIYYVLSLIFTIFGFRKIILNSPITFITSILPILLGSLTVGMLVSVMFIECVKLGVKGYKEKNYIFLIVYLFATIFVLRNLILNH